MQHGSATRRLFWAVFLALLLPAMSGRAADTTLVSVDSSGVHGNSASWEADISGDGRFVVFTSAASNLVPADTNGDGAPNIYKGMDVFIHDRLTSTTTRVSVSSQGLQGNRASYSPAISADGRFVAFLSEASNLIVGDTNRLVDVFVQDRVTGIVTRVSVDSNGQAASNATGRPAISADGRFVAFDSFASNLVAGDTNGRNDVFVHDRLTGATTRVSVDSAGQQADDSSFSPDISADGRFVVFHSNASNLVVGDTNADDDVFVHDRLTGTTTRVSVDSAGQQGNDFDPNTTYVGGSSAISADGRFVAFGSNATNLVPDDDNGETDVFIHDRTTGATVRVPVDVPGVDGNSRNSGAVSITADGRFVTFTSWTFQVPNDELGVFVHDRIMGTTLRLDQGRGAGVTSVDGHLLAFSSVRHLVPGDVNSLSDIFVLDRCQSPTPPSGCNAQ